MTDDTRNDTPQTAPMLGKLIVIEGIDGAGTTTQATQLVLALLARNVHAVRTHEPSIGPAGGLIRSLLRMGAQVDPEAMALLFAADRLDHLAREVEPALARGAVVVCDRYDLSTLTYQTATHPKGKAILPWLRAINSRARRPDLTIVVDVPAELAEQRRSARGQAAELFERRELQERLAGLYAESEVLSPGDRVVHIDGSRSQKDVAEVVLRYSLACIEGRLRTLQRPRPPTLEGAPQCPPEFFTVVGDDDV